jgi:DNA (cytosine-5)-methyltransferase 1
MNCTKSELLIKCEALGITKCLSKNKSQLIELIANKEEQMFTNSTVVLQQPSSTVVPTSSTVVQDSTVGPKFKFIDLFCGIGGFHQASLRLQGECVFACDIDEKCRNIYEKNYGLRPESDITKIDISKIPEFDILCGGFPCQAFSNSGKKKGFEDARGNLFENIISIAIAKRPSFMFLENVKHIKKIDNGNVYKHIISRINASGYVVNEKTIFELSPHQLGVPQQRERVIFVCIRSDIFDITKKIIISPPETPIRFDNILETDPNVLQKYRIPGELESVLNAWNEMITTFEVNENLSPTILCNEFNTTYTAEEFLNLPDWKQEYITKNKPIYQKYKTQWDAWYATHAQILSKKEVYGKLEWQVGKKKEQESIFNHFIQLRQSGIRVKKAVYFPTLVAIVQTPIYAKEKRYITPRECARLQSFPDNFVLHENDHTAYKQFGNAVNVDVVHYVMMNALNVYGMFI